MTPDTQHEYRMANVIRALSMDAVEKAKSGHPGMPMGMADVATVLFRNHLKFDAASPHWFDRDRFVLSAGHGSMLLYSVLYLTGYEQMTIDQIRNFRQWGAITAGHPEYGHAKGIETTTGPLGQGLATAVGMALAERRLAAAAPARSTISSSSTTSLLPRWTSSSNTTATWRAPRPRLRARCMTAQS